MGLGYLVRVRTPSSAGGFVTIAYVVSEPDAGRAVTIIKRKIARLTDEVEAISRVSEQLLDALGVALGEFTRADGRRF